MLIHHNVVISQRLREQSGGMREPWQHGTGGRQADKGLKRGKEELEVKLMKRCVKPSLVA
ncbi:hypothetical protein PAMP_020680 [Pampus punctatissimus]